MTARRGTLHPPPCGRFWLWALFRSLGYPRFPRKAQNHYLFIYHLRSSFYVLVAGTPPYLDMGTGVYSSQVHPPSQVPDFSTVLPRHRRHPCSRRRGQRGRRMSGRMDWRRARLAGRPSLDHRHEHDVPDRAERWLRAVARRRRERRNITLYRSTTAGSSI